MMDEVGEGLLVRFENGVEAYPAEFGYRDVVDLADMGKELEASCWRVTKSFSNVAFRFWARSSSALVLDMVSRSNSSSRCSS